MGFNLTLTSSSTGLVSFGVESTLIATYDLVHVKNSSVKPFVCHQGFAYVGEGLVFHIRLETG
jgi:hypothetical protein